MIKKILRFTQGWNLAFNRANIQFNTMKKMILLTTLSLATGTAFAQSFGGGRGTASDPFLISSRAHLGELAMTVNGGTSYEGYYFKLTTDLTGITTIIGKNEDYPFRGVFNGYGHTIELNINTAEDYAGVFGYLFGATIKNTKVSGRIVLVSSSRSYAGGICGSANNSTISNCYNTGSISASAYESYAGGICGYASSNSSIFSNCYNTGNITNTSSTSSSYAGGICGITFYGTTSSCYNTGNISASAYAHVPSGGICGFAQISTINNCYNMGNISAYTSYSSSSTGGICGSANNSFINNCFAANATITVSRYSDAGRIEGSANGSTSNCHALTSMKINDLERHSMDANHFDGADGEEAVFKNESWLTSVLEWDFETVWTISGSNGWPVLKDMEEPTGNISLEIAPSTLDFTASGETKSVTVTSNVSWTVESNAAWITVSSSSGNNNGSIRVTAAANTATSQRTGTVTVRGENISKTVSITQAAYVPSTNTLTVSSATLNFTAASETKYFTITSNVSWTVGKDVTWITVSPESGSNNGTIVVTAAANTATSQREGIVTVSGGGIDQIISITQATDAPPTLTVSTSTLNFTAAGETKSVTITSNDSWTAVKDAEWITVTPPSGSNNGTISVTAAANTTTSQRTGFVAVTGGGIMRIITVTQAADGTTPPEPTLTVSATDVEVAAEGGSQDITIESNTSWTAVSSDAWAIVSPASGINNGTVSIKASANSTENIRTATVTIAGGGLTRTVTVTQKSDRVGNATVGVTDVYYFDSRLYVNTPVAERIAIYSLDGIRMYQSQKQPGVATFDLRNLPRGVMIVRGDSGWVKKEIKQ
jgi:hypothetical protein